MPDVYGKGSAAAERLRTAADDIAVEVRQLSPALLTWIPGEGVWSVMDILCHIREFVPFWTRETLRICSAPDELWGRDHTDTARVAAVTDTAAHHVDEVLDAIAAAVRVSTATLETLTDEQLRTEATSTNPRWGRKPASFVVEHLLVAHIQKHLGQIRRNVRQFADVSSATTHRSEPRTGGAGTP